MSTITAMGIDLAKNVFQICGVNKAGKSQFNKKVKRDQLVSRVSKYAPKVIYMEACGSAHYWGKRFQSLGFDVKLIAGQHVKKFVVGNKNDNADARAIVTCGQHAETRFVPIKNNRQLAVQAVHRVRSRLVKERTALANEMRAFLYEHGIVIPQGRRKLEANVKELIRLDQLPVGLKELFVELFAEYLEKAERIAILERSIEKSFADNPKKAELLKIPGIGPITASAILTEISDPGEFQNGRHLAAYFGLVPKHSGSGGKNQVLSISKRGDTYIRCLLIHGARSRLRHTANKKDGISKWCNKLGQRVHTNKVAVALANKNARIIWAILTKDEPFNPNLAA